ncbi:MAG TPA: hypothetical protein VNT01_04090 [Symbiobacteriaceae bacterium]|nr:hypothetical protein [Symbiobacteriaceae bacterium]
MARQLRIVDPVLARQAQRADEVYIGKKLFVAVLVDDGQEAESLTPEEVEMVKQALADTRPPLRGEAALEYLRQRGKEIGLD